MPDARDDPRQAAYLAGCRAEGQASHAEHAAAMAGAADAPCSKARARAYADGMTAYLACAAADSTAWPRRVQAPDAWHLASATAWLREGLRLESDEVGVDPAASCIGLHGVAAAAIVEGALLEHARVRHALDLSDASVEAAFAALRPALAETASRTVAAWMSADGGLASWLAGHGWVHGRIVWTSLFTPRLAWSRSSAGGPALILQPRDGGYIVDRAPSLVRVALLDGRDLHELGDVAPPDLCSVLGQVAGRPVP